MKTKRLLCLFLACVLMIGFAACGKNKGEKNGTASTGEATPNAETGNQSTDLTLTGTPSAETPTPTGADPTEVTTTPTLTAEPTEVPATATPTPIAVVTVGPWPKENCTIQFPDRELYHYDMNLALNTADCTVGGHVVFTFYNDSEESWNELCLRDYSSHFTDAKTAGYDPDWLGTNDIKGAPTEITNLADSRDTYALSYTRDENDASVVWIALATPLAPGEHMTLSYDFTAKIPSVADRYGYYEDVYNVTNFYPILAEYDGNGWSHEAFINCGECFYSEVSNYDVRLTVPKDFLVASTGTEVSKTADGDTVTYTYNAPCVRDFVFSASDGFTLKKTVSDGVTINLYYPSFMDEDDYWDGGAFGNQMAGACEAAMNSARDSLAAFGEAFGRYPYEELDIIIARIDAGGMEYPNLIIITDQECYPVIMFDPDFGENGAFAPDDRDMPEKLSFYSLENVVAHEIGHQWFMGIVGSNSGMEPWLDESLTSYTEVVFEEYRARDKGTDALIPVVERLSRKVTDMGNVSELKYMMQRGMIPFNQAYYEFNNDNDYLSAIYQECQRALYQMEEILGRKEFHSVLREYVRRNAFTNSTTARFFEVLFEYAGTDNADLNRLIANTFDLDRIK